MDVLTIVVALAVATAAGGLCGGVVATWLRREHPEAADISELAVVVERIQKAVRRLTMRAVRMGELDTDEGAAATAKAQNPPLPAPLSAKQALRARVFSQMMRGNGGGPGTER